MNPAFSLKDLNYDLPERLIAQEPSPRREDARLLVVDRRTSQIHDFGVAQLPELLAPGDLLVVNNTKVLPARFLAHRQSGGQVPGLFVREECESEWIVMLRGSRRLSIGDVVTAEGPDAENVGLELTESLGDGQWRVSVHAAGTAEQVLDRIGRAPLPPYIKRNQEVDARDSEDRQRYQTVYADKAGAVAAPTAGLHMTQDLMTRIRAGGIEVAEVTLHVGLGTFKPIQAESIQDHVMHTETFDLPEATAASVNACKQRDGRVVAVGTTSVRVLESVARHAADLPEVASSTGATDLFIYPPYRFRIVDALITNFHLPKSTLLALVMAFGGVDLIKRAYRAAVDRRYRFYSYGDAMLII